MILLWTILFLCIGSSAFFFIFYEFYTSWYNYFLLIPFMIASFLAWSIIYVLILVIGAQILKHKDVNSNSKLKYFFVKQTAYYIYFVTRIKVKIINKELEPKEKYLVVSNHKSNFDPFLLYRCLKTNPFALVTKPANTTIMVFGPWIKYSGSLVIDKNDNFAAVKSIAQAVKYIKSGEASVGIYPEGKRVFEEGMIDFHPGSFKIATKAQCPILIASSKNTEQIKFRFPKRTNVTLKYIKVLQYEDYKDMNTQELAQYCHDLIFNDLYPNGVTKKSR